MVLTLLCLQNCSFLDESWLLPVRARLSLERSFRRALAEKSNEEDEEDLVGRDRHAALRPATARWAQFTSTG